MANVPRWPTIDADQMSLHRMASSVRAQDPSGAGDERVRLRSPFRRGEDAATIDAVTKDVVPVAQA